ncbi:ABC transporter ATP-binding protein [Microbaculum sp. FT89]|uniref:ABC transporter ATP-binding protein n=1 Tax=Microbaculum sp. FT89 TaxID=3447298 RepID=UPI003F52B7FD
MSGASVTIKDLHKSYGNFKAVDGVSLDVASGEFVTLLGLSGSGKTTTLMAVAGFVEQDAGTISIDGKDLSSLPPEKRGLGVVFQNYALFPNLDVYENIAFPLRMRRWRETDIKTAVSQVLGLISLDALGGRRVSELSGGQQQRVALARALVFRPSVLLMDEPLGALDRSMRDQMQGEIKRIQREYGVTVIYVTHDQEEAMALSDRIAVMADGKIRQLGAPAEIYERPASAFIAQFVGTSNRVDVETGVGPDDAVRVRSEAQPRCEFVTSGTSTAYGGKASMIVRPEAIRICKDEPAGAPNRLPATVVLREFLGSSIRYALETEVGPFVVTTGRLSAQADFPNGQTVWLSWEPSDALLFAREERT